MQAHINICDNRKYTNNNVNRRYRQLFCEDLVEVVYEDDSECVYFTKRSETGSFTSRPDEVGSKDNCKVQWCHLVHFLMVCNLEQGKPILAEPIKAGYMLLQPMKVVQPGG